MKRGMFPALLLAALVLRLQGLDWDQGRGLHPDEGNLVRAAAGLGPGQLIPDFHAYNDLALWLPKLLALPFCDTGAESCLRLTARVLSALFSTASVWAMAAIALRLAGPVAMLTTALLAALSEPLIQWAHFGTTESALLMLTTLLWLQALRWQRGEIDNKNLALTSALLLAAGFGMKSSALAAAAIPLAALTATRRPVGPILRCMAWALPLTLALALLAVPSLIFAPADWFAVMRFEGSVVDGSLQVFWTRQFYPDSGPIFQLRQIWLATFGAGSILAVTGLFSAKTYWRGLIPGLTFALIYAALCFGWYAAFFRYLAPLFPVVLILAGLGASHLLKSPWQSPRAVAVALMVLATLPGLDLAASYQATDPRILAEEALRARAAIGDRLAVEPYDLPQTAGLEVLILPLETAEASELAAVLEAADWIMVASRRNWAVLPEHPAAPLACAYYAALANGDLGFRQVAIFRRASPFGPLFKPGLAAEETRAVFDRPEVILLRNEAQLDRAELTERLTAPAGDCTPKALASAWEPVR